MIKIYEKIPLQVFSDDLKDVFWAIRLLNSGSCPHCRRICPKDGLFKEKQRYFCKSCHHRFSQNSSTIFSSMKINYDLFYLISQYFLIGLTAKQSKYILDLHYNDPNGKICSILQLIPSYYTQLHNDLLDYLPV